MHFDRYATASQRLLRYAELNKDDSSFERQRGEIVYLFDTSVLESYWRRDPQGAGGRYGTDDLLTEQAALFSGWLSLKYLIENRLPGQKQSGFVSPSHWNEAIDRIQRLENETRQELRANSTFTKEELDRIFNTLTRIERDPVRLLKEAEQHNVGKLFTSIMQAVSRGERIRRVFLNGRNNNPSIRDLTTCTFYSHLLGSKVRHQDFRRWYLAIGDHRYKYEQMRGKRPIRITRNVESDAITLASIQTMYRGNPEASGEKPTVRFVFVTADISIHDAYRDLNPGLEKEGISYFLRHPHIYAPLLNHANMSQVGVSKTQLTALKTVFERVEEALEPLFHNYDLQSGLVQTYDRRLNYNVKRWSSNVETICLANSHYVLSDTAGEYVSANNLARVLSSPDVRTAAASSVSEEIGRIRDAHIQVMSMIALDSLKQTSENMRSSGATAAEHRAPVKLIGVNIASELGYPTTVRSVDSAWIDTLLRSFRDSQADQSPDEIIERLQRYWDDDRLAPAVQLLASCIFFAANAWESARLCAELCQKRVRGKRFRNVWLREAYYCEALAIRMQLRSKEDVQRGTEILTHNIADHSDSLASVRDRVERATLILTAAIVQTVEDRFYQGQPGTHFVDLIPRTELHTQFEAAISDLELGLKFVTSYERSDEAATAAQVRLQAEINLLGAFLFGRVLDRLIADDAIDITTVTAARSALVSTFEKTGFNPSMTAKMYLTVSDALVVGTEPAIRSAVDFLISKDVTDSIMSIPDECEVRYFKEYLLGRLGSKVDPVA